MGKTNLKVVKNMDPSNRNQTLDAVLKQIERSFDKGAIMRLGDEKIVEVEAIPTGSITLDVALKYLG